MNASDKPFAEFGRRLNEQMALHKVKASDITKKLQVSVATVNFWRAGVSTPRAPKDTQLARMFNVSLGYLRYGEGDASPAQRPRSSVMSAIHEALEDLTALQVTDLELMPVLQCLLELNQAKQEHQAALISRE